MPAIKTVKEVLICRTPKHYHQLSRIEERTERLNTPYRCPKSGELQRKRCSRSSRRVNIRARAGRGW